MRRILSLTLSVVHLVGCLPFVLTGLSLSLCFLLTSSRFRVLVSVPWPAECKPITIPLRAQRVFPTLQYPRSFCCFKMQLYQSGIIVKRSIMQLFCVALRAHFLWALFVKLVEASGFAFPRRLTAARSRRGQHKTIITMNRTAEVQEEAVS
jgi:hypothetical protein